MEEINQSIFYVGGDTDTTSSIAEQIIGFSNLLTNLENKLPNSEFLESISDELNEGLENVYHKFKKCS